MNHLKNRFFATLLLALGLASINSIIQTADSTSFFDSDDSNNPTSTSSNKPSDFTEKEEEELENIFHNGQHPDSESPTTNPTPSDVTPGSKSSSGTPEPTGVQLDIGENASENQGDQAKNQEPTKPSNQPENPEIVNINLPTPAPKKGWLAKLSRFFSSDTSNIIDEIKDYLDSPESSDPEKNPLTTEDMKKRIQKLSTQDRARLFSEITQHEINKEHPQGTPKENPEAFEKFEKQAQAILDKNYFLFNPLLPENEILMERNTKNRITGRISGGFEILDMNSYNENLSIQKNAQRFEKQNNLKSSADTQATAINIRKYLEKHPTVKNVTALINDVFSKQKSLTYDELITKLQNISANTPIKTLQEVFNKMTRNKLTIFTSTATAKEIFIKRAESYQKMLPEGFVIIPIMNKAGDKSSFQYEIINTNQANLSVEISPQDDVNTAKKEKANEEAGKVKNEQKLKLEKASIAKELENFVKTTVKEIKPATPATASNQPGEEPDIHWSSPEISDTEFENYYLNEIKKSDNPRQTYKNLFQRITEDQRTLTEKQLEDLTTATDAQLAKLNQTQEPTPEEQYRTTAFAYLNQVMENIENPDEAPANLKDDTHNLNYLLKPKPDQSIQNFKQNIITELSYIINEEIKAKFNVEDVDSKVAQNLALEFYTKNQQIQDAITQQEEIEKPAPEEPTEPNKPASEEEITNLNDEQQDAVNDYTGELLANIASLTGTTDLNTLSKQGYQAPMRILELAEMMNPAYIAKKYSTYAANPENERVPQELQKEIIAKMAEILQSQYPNYSPELIQSLAKNWYEKNSISEKIDDNMKDFNNDEQSKARWENEQQKQSAEIEKQKEKIEKEALMQATALVKSVLTQEYYTMRLSQRTPINSTLLSSGNVENDNEWLIKGILETPNNKDSIPTYVHDLTEDEKNTVVEEILNDSSIQERLHEYDIYYENLQRSHQPEEPNKANEPAPEEPNKANEPAAKKEIRSLNDQQKNKFDTYTSNLLTKIASVTGLHDFYTLSDQGYKAPVHIIELAQMMNPAYIAEQDPDYAKNPQSETSLQPELQEKIIATIKEILQRQYPNYSQDLIQSLAKNLYNNEISKRINENMRDFNASKQSQASWEKEQQQQWAEIEKNKKATNPTPEEPNEPQANI